MADYLIAYDIINGDLIAKSETEAFISKKGTNFCTGKCQPNPAGPKHDLCLYLLNT